MRYNIKKGDTLSGIAKRFGTSWSKLAKDNKIMNPDRIRAGSSIIVPSMDRPNMEAQVIRAKEKQPLTKVKDQLVDARQQAKIIRSQEDLGRRPQEKGINFSLFPQAQAMPKKETQMSYKVKKGDTFNAIAKRNNMTPDQLAELNKGIKNRNKISVGQNIKLKDDRGFFGRASDYLFGEDEPKQESIMQKPKEQKTSRGSIVPENIAAYVRYIAGNKLGLSEGEDIDVSKFGTDQQNVLIEAIKNAEKDGRTNVTYEDFPKMKSGELPADYYRQKRKSRNLFDLGYESFVDPSFEMFTTVGKFNFKNLGDGKYEILPDRYDFSKAKSGGASRGKAKDAYGMLTHLGQDVSEDENYSFNVVGVVGGG